MFAQYGGINSFQFFDIIVSPKVESIGGSGISLPNNNDVSITRVAPSLLNEGMNNNFVFGFATTNNEENANLLIQKLNGFEFNGSKLRVELSEKKDSASNKRNSGNLNKNKKRKDFKKIVHSDAPNLEAPDPRWAGELSKLKDLLANQKTPA